MRKTWKRALALLLTACMTLPNVGGYAVADVSHVHAEESVENTKKRILEHQMEKRADVFLESHAKMQKYAKEETVDCIVFNFGYLPGGDHQLIKWKE